LYKLQQDASLAALFLDNDQSSQVEALLAKRAENRALTPEEYDTLARFVDRVEKRSIARFKAEKEVTVSAELEALNQSIPASVVSQNILDSSLPEHVAYILQEAGYATVGDLAMQMKAHPDDILRLQGIGPKAMAEITHLMEQLAAQKITEEAAAQELAEAAVAEAAQLAESAAPAIEPVVESTPQPEQVLESSEPEAQIVEPVVQADVEGESVEEETTFESIFTLRPEMVDTAVVEEAEDEEETTSVAGKTKKSKKKRKSVEVVYDPDRDVVVSKKKHKRGAAEWDWES
jgi:N utilization substance protein A